MKQQYPLHIHISTLFIALVTLTGLLLGLSSYYEGRAILASTADKLTTRVSQQTQTTLHSMVKPAQMAVNLIRAHPLIESSSTTERLRHLPFLRQVLDNADGVITSLYLAYGDGDFFYLHTIENDNERFGVPIPAHSRYIVQTIEGERGQVLFFDTELQQLQQLEQPDYPQRYNPRQRPWYQAAIGSDELITTRPYPFFTSGKSGYTIAGSVREEGVVIGVDILTETLDKLMSQQKITPSAVLLLITPQGAIIAHEQMQQLLQQRRTEGLPTLSGSGDPLLQAIAQQPLHSGDSYRTVSLEEGDWLYHLTPFLLQGAGDILLLSAMPEPELFAEAYTILKRSALTSLAIILAVIPVIWWLSNHLASSIRQVARYAERLRHFDFSSKIEAHPSLIIEVNELALTLKNLQSTINTFQQTSTSLVAEHDYTLLLPYIVKKMLAISTTRYGLLYIYNNKLGRLEPTVAIHHSGNALPLPTTPLDCGSQKSLATLSMLDGSTRSSELSAAEMAALGLPPLPDPPIYQVAVPLLNRQQQPIGLLLLLREQQPVDDAQISFIEAFSGLVAVTLENRQLTGQHKKLFESFIQLIGSAIDTKSRYTGNHCARVPELTQMLAQAAQAESSGPFADFQLTPAEQYELHIASWLHDCGKITTPEYVVDKATKLETIYNRIHEVRQRFEILKRDAEIQCYQAILRGESDAQAKQQCQQQQQQLDQEFAFIAECNIGNEFMDPANIDRLKQIGARTWQRTLDDRLGLSYMELQRYSEPPQPLPVTETLLTDRAEQRIARPADEVMPIDNPWGFKLESPELLYNRGELYNLSISYGTLTTEERYKINDHIIQTQMMLSQLEFPEGLGKVVDIAGNHHETLDGRGYPRRLTAKELSTTARMVAIADIFEALTADDRPYKKGKCLSEALKILASMSEKQHIDAELFALFLRSNIIENYAKRNLNPAQIDMDSAAIAAFASSLR
ncbi:phosphohydrolase [Ectothiorhodospiraceae bacterium BW-2]|nr:phosphohydrolase [Ectothiorhodospiraceae bacterium BW-2]